jgi:hypothetical protein
VKSQTRPTADLTALYFTVPGDNLPVMELLAIGGQHSID